MLQRRGGGGGAHVSVTWNGKVLFFFSLKQWNGGSLYSGYTVLTVNPIPSLKDTAH